MKVFVKAVLSGIMISIGTIVYLSCENKVVGAFLFSIALFSICSFRMNLFTGKIGYAVQNRNNPNCIIIWLGNLTGCALASALARLAKPNLVQISGELMKAKLNLSLPSAAALGFFCGILMYIAVENYASNPSGAGKLAGIFLCIPTFILSGFEHSIADMGYAALAVKTPAQAARFLAFVVVVSISNGIGSILIHTLYCYGKK